MEGFLDFEPTYRSGGESLLRKPSLHSHFTACRRSKEQLRTLDIITFSPLKALLKIQEQKLIVEVKRQK